MTTDRLVIGLSGGIGSGKSEVATRFAKLGVDVIDADQLAHQLLKPDSEPFQQTVKHFGNDILHKNGTINRGQLRKIAFNNPRERRWLEQLLHPIIRATMAEKITDSTAPYVMLVIPLLIENWPHPLVNRVLIVDVDEARQKRRTRQRDKTTEAQIDAIIANQASREQRLAHADDIINNCGSLAQLNAEVAKLHKYYLTLCQQKYSHHD